MNAREARDETPMHPLERLVAAFLLALIAAVLSVSLYGMTATGAKRSQSLAATDCELVAEICDEEDWP